MLLLIEDTVSLCYCILFKMYSIFSYYFLCSNLLPLTLSALQARDSSSLDMTAIHYCVCKVTSPVSEIAFHGSTSRETFFWVTEEEEYSTRWKNIVRFCSLTCNFNIITACRRSAVFQKELVLSLIRI